MAWSPKTMRAARQAESKKPERILWWQVSLFLIGLPFLVVMETWSRGYLRDAWPGAPEWLSSAAVLAPVALVGALLAREWFGKRPKSAWMAGEEARIALFTTVFFFVVNALPKSHSLVGVLGSLYGIFAVWGILLSRNDLALKLTRKPVLSGDPERAMRRLRWLELGHPTALMLGIEGTIHTVAGRGAEAEKCFREALATAGAADVTLRDETLCQLGLTLAGMGRDEEARECLESAASLGDRTGVARAFLAELLLQRGTEPEEALNLIEESVKNKALPALAPGRLAIKAQALAALGRLPEMDESIAAALLHLDPNAKEVAASTHLNVGHALLRAHRIPEATGHFRAACHTRPGGEASALAQRELERLSTPPQPPSTSCPG